MTVQISDERWNAFAATYIAADDYCRTGEEFEFFLRASHPDASFDELDTFLREYVEVHRAHVRHSGGGFGANDDGASA